MTCEFREKQSDEKVEIGDERYGLIYSKSEYGEMENGVRDLKRRKRSRFVGV